MLSCGAMCVLGARGRAPAPEPVACMVGVPCACRVPECHQIEHPARGRAVAGAGARRQVACLVCVQVLVAGVPTRGPVVVLVLCAYPWAMCVLGARGPVAGAVGVLFLVASASPKPAHQIERMARPCWAPDRPARPHWPAPA